MLEQPTIMVSIKSHSGIYRLESAQLLNTSISEAWNFFSDPENLSKITPRHMGFQITSGKPQKMYRGQMIAYKVTPFAGFRTNWVTEISQVSEKQYFVDEQRFGPYRMWHHEHHFETRANGILMTDRVSYKLPLGVLGRLAHFIFVKRQLMKIFTFRETFLDSVFNQKQSPTNF